jgi:Holliday junction DNA helicase RuvA
MIAFLRGEVAHVGLDAVTLDVGGVGYQVFLSKRHLAELPGLGAVLRIFTHLVHREDAMLLYGFSSLDERELFLMLLSVSGVGAKTALGVLSALTVGDVVAAVVGNNPRSLAKAPGIGKKSAERIVLELREKLAAWRSERSDEPARGGSISLSGAAGEVESALAALGYTEDEITQALDRLDVTSDVEDTLRRALALLSGY